MTFPFMRFATLLQMLYHDAGLTNVARKRVKRSDIEIFPLLKIDIGRRSEGPSSAPNALVVPLFSLLRAIVFVFVPVSIAKN